MKRKLMILVCSFAVTAALTACGGKKTETPVPSEVTEEPTEEPEEEPTETPTPTEEPEETKGGTAAIITDEDLEEADLSEGMIRGGTNQDDAVMLPMNTFLSGEARDKKGLWYAFTTGSDASASYKITTVNKSGDGYIGMFLYDDMGECIYKFASPNGEILSWEAIPGCARTVTLDDLEPNTVYYIKMAVTERTIYNTEEREGTIDYTLIIRDSGTEKSAYATTDALLAARGEAEALEGEINPGRHQLESAYIPTGVKIGGTVSDCEGSWFAFTTNGTKGTYDIITIDKSVDTEGYLGMFLIDEYGEVIGRTGAGSDGAATTYSTDELEPNTTYYIMLTITDRTLHNVNMEGTIDYTMQINAPKEPEARTATIEKTKEQQVFQQPFELNETQIMFKPESADFVDPTAAETALKPVADIILAHPNNKILLAGTTATDGDQANRVKLSERRADAVKQMLVDKFNVPESQLLVKGLGYADDPFERGVDRNPAGDPKGTWIDSEAPRNRRVIVMDAESDIAKQILGK